MWKYGVPQFEIARQYEVPPQVTVWRELGCKIVSARRGASLPRVRDPPSRFGLSGTSADRGVRTANPDPIPWPGAIHPGLEMPSRDSEERKAGVHQVATASFTCDVIVQRWALDKQLTEDTDRTWRKRLLAYNH